MFEEELKMDFGPSIDGKPSGIDLSLQGAKSDAARGRSVNLARAGDFSGARTLINETRFSTSLERSSALNVIDSIESKSEQVRFVKDENSYKDIMAKMLDKTATQEDAQRAGFKDEDDLANFKQFIKGSYKPNPESTTPIGQGEAHKIVFDNNSGEASAGKLTSLRKLMDLRYVDRNITDDTYMRAVDRIHNPYPRDMVSNIKATIIDQGRDWWGTSKSEKNIVRANEEWSEWFDKKIKDDSFNKMNPDQQLDIMKKAMGAFVSQIPVEEIDYSSESTGVDVIKWIKVISPGGEIREVRATQFERAIREGYKAIN